MSVLRWSMIVLLFGVNFVLWGGIGLIRIAHGALARRFSTWSTEVRRVELDDVAVLMAAHNEEVVITDSLSALLALVHPEHVYVVSDFSNDRTVELARALGVNVVETPSNVGKAGALEYGIAAFDLLDRYEAVMLLDADTRLDTEYFVHALPLLDDPGVAAVAGCAHSHWRTCPRVPRSPQPAGFRYTRRPTGGGITWAGRVITAHRSRVYFLTQRLIKYGQTWRLTNATHIVPGFASLYRTRALRHIEINPPGLVIEDFNMTFEVHRKRLGRVAFSPRAIAVTQDPDNLHDYVKQTRRWALGLWQTTRRHGLRHDLMSFALALLLGELVSASLLLLALPLLVVLLTLPLLFPPLAGVPLLGPLYADVSRFVGLDTVAIGVLGPDYLLTIAAAVVERRARYLLSGPLFLALRVVDAWIALDTLPRAWSEQSNGRWVSPTRRDPNADRVAADVVIDVVHPLDVVHAIDVRDRLAVPGPARTDDEAAVPLTAWPVDS